MKQNQIHFNGSEYLNINKRMTYYKIVGIFFLVFIFIYYHRVFGQTTQTGSLSGTVVDVSTGKPLPGVNIILKGTVLGTSTNLDGEFTLSGIRAGTYSVMASMIGYKIKTFHNVKIFPNNTTILDFRLVETVIEFSTIIVTASKKSKSLAETPNSVSVISALDIRKRNSVDIRDALKYAPGISFVGGQVNIRGTTGYSRGAGSRVLLLTDGVPTMPGDSGDIKWDTIPFTVVEKVEVVKGAASALYGSSAIGGVVNILTKEPSQKPELSVRISGGIYDSPFYNTWKKWTNKVLITNQQDLFFSNTQGNLGYLFSVGRRESRGYKENSQFLKWNVFGKTNYKFNSTSNLSFTGSYATDDHGDSFGWLNILGQPAQPHLVSEQQAGNTIFSTKLYLNSTFNNLASQNYAYKVRASYYRNRFDNHFRDNNDRSTAQRFRGEYQADFEPSLRHSATFGLEGNLDLVDGTIFGRQKAYIIGVYAQDEYKFTDRLSATGGFRFDYSKVISGQTEYQLTPRLGLIYNVSDATTLRGSIGRGFRAPSIAELFTETSTSGFRVIPNPDLDAESSWSAEVGMNMAIKNQIFLNVAVYQERYFDFINPSLGFQDANAIIQFKNVQDARIRGMETNVTTSWFSNKLNTVLSYVFVDPRDLQTKKLLTYRPQHILTTSITFKPNIFEFGADFRFASRLKDEQLELDPDEPRVSQKVLDVRAGLTVGPYTFMFNVENVLYYNYTQLESNLEPTRQYSLTWQGDF